MGFFSPLPAVNAPLLLADTAGVPEVTWLRNKGMPKTYSLFEYGNSEFRNTRGLKIACHLSTEREEKEEEEEYPLGSKSNYSSDVFLLFSCP